MPRFDLFLRNSAIVLSLCVAPQAAFAGTPTVPDTSTATAATVASRQMSAAKTGPEIIPGYGHLPLSFEVNQGQTDNRVRFLSRGKGYILFLTPTEAVLSKTVASQEKGKKSQSTNVLRMRLLDANPDVRVTGTDELPGKSNYLLGRDPKKWRTNIRTYKKVAYEQIYPGIDLVYYGNQRELEYDFVVNPGADPRLIHLQINGARELHSTQQGGVMLLTEGGEFTLEAPRVYQEIAGRKHSVRGEWVIRRKNELAFQLEHYDHSKSLVIDPVLLYSTYLGGAQTEVGNGIAVDTAGNAYITGITTSADFPTANPLPAPNNALQGAEDAFVTKLNADGSALVYSTFLGGTASDEGGAIAVDSSGNAYITGFTNSDDFPLVNPVFSNRCISLTQCATVFVSKLSSAGNSLLFSTFADGAYGRGIAVDSANNIYTTGNTFDGYEATANAYQTTYGGGANSGDAFLTAYNSSGAVTYATYLGGRADDVGQGIAIDANGKVHIVGQTQSSNFPVLNPLPAPNNALQGSDDAFVTEMDPTLSGAASLIYSTFLGGTGNDKANGVAVDASGNSYVGGWTDSTDFPTTAGAYQTGCTGACSGGSDAFVAKLSPAGNSLVYSTYVGGGSIDQANALAVDTAGNVFITGFTDSFDFPTLNAFQDSCGIGCDGTGDAFVTQLNSSGTALVYSSYLGGSGDEFGQAIAVDSADEAFVTGYTFSGDFTTLNPLQPALNGSQDAFVAKITVGAPPTCTVVPIEVGFTITASIQCTGAFVPPTNPNNQNQQILVHWNDPSGDTSGTGSGGGSDCGVSGNNCSFSPSNTYPAGAGSGFTVEVDVTDAGNQTTTIFQPVTVGPLSVSVTPLAPSLVVNSTRAFTATVGNATDTTVTWSATSGTISPSGSYTAPSSVPSGTVTVKALSNADNTTFGTATVQVTDFALSLSSSAADVGPGQGTSTTVTVSSVNGFAGTVSLSCAGGLPTGVSCSFNPPAVSVSATQSATSELTISTTSGTPAGTASIVVTGTLPSVTHNQTFTLQVLSAGECGLSLNPTAQSFTAAGGSGTIAVTTSCNWTAATTDSWITITGGNSGAGNGTVTYSVSANTTTEQRVGTISVVGAGSTIFAFSITQSGEIAVTGLTPSPASVQIGGTQQFTVSVINTTTTSVTWSVSGSGCDGGPCGVIDQTGLYTAPATLSASQVDTVTATSVALPTASESTQVTIFLPPTVPSPPPPQTVTDGQSANYAITVAGGTGDPSQPTTLSCKQSSLPNGVTCTFSPAQVTFGSSQTSFQLTLNTTGSRALLSPPSRHEHNLPLYASLFPLAGVVLLGLGGKRRRKRLVPATCAGLCLALLLLSACGTNGSFGTPPPQSLTTTPPGQYTVVVQGQTSSQRQQGVFAAITSVSITVH